MDLRKLQSEVDPKNTIEALEILRADTSLFASWNKFEMQKLAENIKILSFGRNATIMQKNEMVEYFALILGGKLFIKQGDKVVGHMGPGDVLGYMSYMEFPGTKASPFDVTAEVEGYIAVFRYDEFKMLSKKEPQLSYKITEMLSKKAMNAVYLQYTGEEVYTPFKLAGTGSVTNTKKVKDAMDTCPELAEFFERIDPRDKKNLTKNVEYIEFEREQKILCEGKASDFILFLIKGELIGFRENKPTVFYKPGAIIGVKEFLFHLTWQENILGRAKGVLLKLERSKYEEMIINCNPSLNNFLKALTWHECKEIKNRYQDRSMFVKLKDQNVTNPANEFIEYEIAKHLDFVNQQQKKSLNSKPLIKEFLLQKETLPLHMHSIHQAMFTNQNQVVGKPGKAPPAAEGCSFLRDKMEKQLEDQRSKKVKGKTGVKTAKGAVDPKKADERPDEDFEDLKNSFTLLERENEEIRGKLDNAFEENKALKNQLRQMKELNMTSSSRINKTLMHKELVSKDLINSDPSSILNRNYNAAFSSFGDVLKEQHLVSAKAKRVARYAYRWLAAVRTKKKMMLA